MLTTPDLAAHVADTVREPLLVLDDAVRVVAANRAFYRVFSVTPEETLGVPLFELGDGQWNRAGFRSLLEEVLPQQSEFEEFEVACEFPRIGHRVMWLSGREIIASPSAGAGTRAILLAIEDVTARRLAERALAARTRELEESNRELERFATVASHDLQEPLRKIRTYGDLLRQRCADSLDDRGRDYVERMSQAARRMQALIGDLLSLARITAQTRPALVVELDQIVREVVVDLEVALREAGGRITLGPLPLITADPALMRQLFQNLLSNAIKYRRTDVPLSITLLATTPQWSDVGAQGLHEIVVRDNGIGFEQRHAAQIFEPFGRLHGRGEYAGTGIGLAICRRIVERHGGSISARSAPGDGASFVLHLPATHTHSNGAPASPSLSSSLQALP